MRAANDKTPTRRRAIRSYVLRAGRLTAGQQRALQDLWPKYGLELPAAGPAPAHAQDYARVFNRRAPLHLEIGFGDGEALLEMAARRPRDNFIGAEVHTPGVGRLLLQLESRGLKNVRVFCADGVQVLTHSVAPNSLAALHLYFPDPWPKKKHHKRRLLQPKFIELVVSRLRVGGGFYFATDWQPYAAQALALLEESPALAKRAAAGEFLSTPAARPSTKFERRGRKLGHAIYDMEMTRAR